MLSSAIFVLYRAKLKNKNGVRAKYFQNGELIADCSLNLIKEAGTLFLGYLKIDLAVT